MRTDFRRTFRCLSLAVYVFCLPSLAFAQTGSLVGTVVDGEVGESVIGANVLVGGTTLGAATDFDGNYRIANVPAGTYDVVFSYIGYTAQRVTGVEVKAGETVRLDITLREDIELLDEVIVEARAIRNNDATLLRDRQKAAGVSDAISAEAISRSGAGDAAAAASRVTGASVVGGKYVYVRGLGDRYSTTQLNGAPLPSADPDRRSFQLDLLPANLIDNIVTTKTFTPDKPGDFSGGLVDVGTKDFPDALTFRFSASTAYNDQASLRDDFLLYNGSATDVLGYDNGTRDIPGALSTMERDSQGQVRIPRMPSRSDFRNRPDSARAVAENISNLSKSFGGEMIPVQQQAPVDQSYAISFGNLYRPWGRDLGVTASLSYGRSSTYFGNGTNAIWRLAGPTSTQEELQSARVFGGDAGVNVSGSVESSWGGLVSMAFRPSANHRVSGTYLRTQSGNSSARELSGFTIELNDPTRTQVSTALTFQERTVQSLQLKGSSLLGSLTADWLASSARNTQVEPDARYLTYDFQRVGDPANPDTNYFVSSGALYDYPSRFFRDLEEGNQTAQLDLTLPVSAFGRLHRLKAGGYYQDIDRTFRQRRFRYEAAANLLNLDQDQLRLADPAALRRGDLATYFTRGVGIIGLDSRGNPVMGNVINDVTSLVSNYDGQQRISAAYLMTDLLLTNKLRFVGGVRYETTGLELTSLDSSANYLPIIENGTTVGRERVGVIDTQDLLPAANLVYSLTDNMNVRLAATRTIARPTFRELAPYQSFEFFGDYVFGGNANLERSLITNLDARYEWFVRPGEILAVSGFYKDFQNPIERVILTERGNDAVSIQNVDRGRVYGLEFEYRQGLGSYVSLLEHVSLGLNLTFIQSAVDIPQRELDIILQSDPDAAGTRPLQGQSPYVVNVDLGYNNPRYGTAVGVFFNQVGDRLDTVTEGATPDIYEVSRPQLDLSISQPLGRGLAVGFRARNLLDASYSFEQQYKNQTYVARSYDVGRTYSLSVSYSLD